MTTDLSRAQARAAELRGVSLTVADVGQACTAMGHACWARWISMAKAVDAMSPQVAGEVLLAVDMLRPYLTQRAQALTAAAHLTPDHPWLPEEET